MWRACKGDSDAAVVLVVAGAAISQASLKMFSNFVLHFPENVSSSPRHLFRKNNNDFPFVTKILQKAFTENVSGTRYPSPQKQSSVLDILLWEPRLASLVAISGD